MADHTVGQELHEARRAFLKPGAVGRQGALELLEGLKLSADASERVRLVIDRTFERVTGLGKISSEALATRIEALTVRCGCCS